MKSGVSYKVVWYLVVAHPLLLPCLLEQLLDLSDRFDVSYLRLDACSCDYHAEHYANLSAIEVGHIVVVASAESRSQFDIAVIAIASVLDFLDVSVCRQERLTRFFDILADNRLFLSVSHCFVRPFC